MSPYLRDARRQALIAHGIPPEICRTLWTRRFKERLKGGIEFAVDLFNATGYSSVKPTTFLEFAQRNAKGFGAAAAAALK